MRLSFGQDMRMSQKQILAPRMIQSMEILQLPILELQARIDAEMAENPTLEVKEPDLDFGEDDFAGTESMDINTPEDKPMVVEESKNNAEDFERLLNLNEEYPDTYEERQKPSSARIEEEGDRKHDAMANMVDRPPSLSDHLHEQLGWFDLTIELRLMCDRIVYNLDANGYLQGRLEDLIEPDAKPGQLQLAQKALATVQQLDPRGVGARDLRECLLLQLAPQIDHYEELKTLVGKHLEDVAENRLPLIAKKTGFSLSLIQELIEDVHKLNPKPGADFGAKFVPNVTPDVFLDVDDNGKYVVRLEDGRMPELFISPQYRRLLQDPSTPAEVRDYIKRKVMSAQWLIESIEQRRSTVTRVSQAIIDHQIEFLNKGPEYIEPLKMQQIADKVGVHVTTVSRAVDDKYIQTPRGIFPLKRFFVGGTTSADGEEVAWDAIRLKLQEVIEKEDKQDPYSDDALVAELAKHGLTVARRTITKYRKAMKIPSSRQRKEWRDGEPVAAELAPGN